MTEEQRRRLPRTNAAAAGAASDPLDGSNHRGVGGGDAGGGEPALLAEAAREARSDARRPRVAVVVHGGAALDAAMAHPLWAAVAPRLDAGVCCRLSAAHKATIPAWFDGAGHPAIAVGDGASDVGMVRAAALGIGLAAEGGDTGANRAAIATVSRFRHLRPLVAVHGVFANLRLQLVLARCLFCGLLLAAMEGWHVFAHVAHGASGVPCLDRRVVAFVVVVLVGVPAAVGGVTDTPGHPEALLAAPGVLKAFRASAVDGVRLGRRVAQWAVAGLCAGGAVYGLTSPVAAAPTTLAGHGYAQGHAATVRTAGAALVVALTLGATVHTWHAPLAVAHVAACVATLVWFPIASATADDPAGGPSGASRSAGLVPRGTGLEAFGATGGVVWLRLLLVGCATALVALGARVVRWRGGGRVGGGGAAGARGGRRGAADARGAALAVGGVRRHAPQRHPRPPPPRRTRRHR